MTQLTRRTVLAGVATAVALSAIPTGHAIASPVQSPIIRLTEKSAVFRRPVCASPVEIAAYYNGQHPLEFVPPVNVQTFRVTAENGQPVGSVEEAEDRLLAAVGDPTMAAYLPKHVSTFCGDNQVSLPILINRGSNLISARTRLGVGDTVLLSPMGLIVLLDHSSRFYSTAGTFSRTEPQKIGRWQQVGKLWTGQNVFVGNHLPADRVYIVRTAGNAQAAMIHEDDQLYLVTDVAASFARSVDFFCCVSVRLCLED